MKYVLAPEAFSGFGAPMATGDPSPAWPLAAGDRRVTADFGAGRPFSSPNPRRHHAAEDIKAPRGTLVLAPEAGVITRTRPTFHQGTGVVMMQTDSGPAIAFGEVEPHSWTPLGIAVGSRVVKGQPIARVGHLNQLHFEMYRRGTTTTHQWPWQSPPPDELLDPTDYLRRALASPEPRPVEPRPVPPPPVQPPPVQPRPAPPRPLPPPPVQPRPAPPVQPKPVQPRPPAVQPEPAGVGWLAALALLAGVFG